MKKFLLTFLLSLLFFSTCFERAFSEVKIDYSTISEITYKITAKNIKENIFVENNNQTNTLSKNGIIYIKVLSENTENKAFIYPLKKNKFKKNLKSNKYIDKNDERIKNAAAAIVKNEQNVMNIVAKAKKWTDANLENNNTSNEIRKIKDILDSGYANKEEKLLIVASLLKASNIPTKIVVGLNYNIDNTIIPKNWIVIYAGDWFDVDLDSGNLSMFTADNIGVYETFLDNNSDLQYFENVKKLIPELKISVLNTKSNLQISIDKISNPVTSDVSEINLLKYIRGDNTEQLNEITVKVDNTGDFINIKTRNDLRQEEIIRDGFYAFVNGDIDKASKSFEDASKQFPINNDYLNVDYATILAKLGLFDLSQQRIANISDYQIWNKKIENLYKTYYPKKIPSKEEELQLSKAISLINFPKHHADTAIETILPYKQYKSSDYANYLYARYYYQKDDLKQASKFVNKALSTYPQNYQYKLLKAQILYSRRKYDQSLKTLRFADINNISDKHTAHTIKMLEYNNLANKSKDESKRNYYLARYYFEKPDLTKAKELLENNISNNSKNIEDYILLGQINIIQDDYKKAELNLKKAVNLDSQSEKALLAYGDINMMLKNRQIAFEYYNKAFKNNKKSKDALKKMAHYYELSSNKACLDYYRQALQYYPDDVQSLSKLAFASYLDGNKIKAAELYKQALSYDQNYLPAWFGLSKIAIDSKNTFIAREYLVPVYYINKFNPEYYYYSGLIANIDGNQTQARENFKKAIELDPSNIKAVIELKKLN